MGSSINDIMQVGELGCDFCDAVYEGLSKTVFYVWHRLQGGQKILKICVRSLMDDPYGHLEQRRLNIVILTEDCLTAIKSWYFFN